MAVKIDIPGIGEVQADNAASEQTLREILKALGGRPGQIDGQGGAGGGSGVGPEAKKASKEIKIPLQIDELFWLRSVQCPQIL